VSAAVIRSDEVLAELRRLEQIKPSGPDGFSTQEMARTLACSEKLTLRKLSQWIAEGVVEFAGLRAGTRVDGRPKKTPVYRLVKKTARR
jgi:predicted ArsR family transcriptional regulator